MSLVGRVTTAKRFTQGELMKLKDELKITLPETQSSGHRSFVVKLIN